MAQDEQTRDRVRSLRSPIERTTLKDEVESRLREAIVTGQIAASARITESWIAQDLGISRAPVREALRSLEQEGLIVSSGYRGFYVRRADIDGLRELFLLRAALERLAIGLAFDRVTDQDLTLLEGIIAEMQVATGARAEEMAELDTRFHEHICRISSHRLLLKTWSSMRDQIRVALATVDVSYPDAEAGGFAESHRAILRALRSPNRRDAEAAMEQHILRGMEHFIAVAEGMTDATDQEDGR